MFGQKEDNNVDFEELLDTEKGETSDEEEPFDEKLEND